jgi:hypothetical protein
MEMTVSWEMTYSVQRRNLEEALKAVKRGAKVFLGTTCAEPRSIWWRGSWIGPEGSMTFRFFNTLSD